MSNTSIAVAIVTISDRSSEGIREDRSGPAIAEFCSKQGWSIIESAIIPDELDMISKTLVQLSNNQNINLIFTTGGTGFSPRDNTPEATLSIIEKNAPGISEYIRLKSMEVTPHAMLSRGVSGIRKKTLIINLPGSPKAAIESIEFILPALPHAIALLHENKGQETKHSPD